MSKILCHYGSRFILKRWSIDPSVNRPRVWCYDTVSDRIENKGIHKLFALPGLNSEKTEKRLNRYLETPIAARLEEILADPSTRESDMKVQRAVKLYFFAQFLRFREAIGDSVPQLDLDKLLEKIENNDPEINLLIGSLEEKTKLAVVRLGHNDILFYPETGYFTAIVLSQSGGLSKQLAVALPFDPKMLVLYAPQDCDESSEQAVTFCRFSVARCDGVARYVVPPELKRRLSDEDIIAEFKRLRLEGEEICKRFDSINQLKTVKGAIEAGLSLPTQYVAGVLAEDSWLQSKSQKKLL